MVFLAHGGRLRDLVVWRLVDGSFEVDTENYCEFGRDLNRSETWNAEGRGRQASSFLFLNSPATALRIPLLTLA